MHRVWELRAGVFDGERCSRWLLPNLGGTLPRGRLAHRKPDSGFARRAAKKDFPRTDKTGGKNFFVPKLCNHCTDSPCTQVCPVGATFHTADGVVLIDYNYCLGCRYCIQACPYGCRFFHPTQAHG